MLNWPMPHATHRAWLYSFWYLPASQPKHSTTESKWSRANPGTQAWHPSPAHPDGQSRQNVAPPESKIQKSVSLDSYSSFVLTHTLQIKKYTYTFNSQRDPSMYVHTVPGTGSDTTSTTNMYNKYRCHVPSLNWPVVQWEQFDCPGLSV